MKISYSVASDKHLLSGEFTLLSQIEEGGLQKKRYAAQAAALIKIELLQECEETTGSLRARLRLTNASEKSVRIGRADVVLETANDGTVLHYFSSNWGREFDPLTMCPTEINRIGVVSGRSSKGYAPWVCLQNADGFYNMATAWSGNWKATITCGKNVARLGMGINADCFFTDLTPGTAFEGPWVYISYSADTMEDACFRMRSYFMRYVSLLGQESAEALPVVYNTWWCFEDRKLNEEACLAISKIIRPLGFSTFMLDAGWFGKEETSEGMDWFQKRGDWGAENRGRFPGGVARLAEAVDKEGLRFGIWCEIEAVGEKAALKAEHPDFLAKNKGRSLGYLCMGDERVRRWAMAVVDRLVRDYHAAWLKFDFNLDPEMGCDVEAHGHGKGDGLYAHYIGFYRLLGEIHVKYPEVRIENCSSGGLRDDLGILEYCHSCFLSDPDYVEHHFQVFWGALSYIPAALCFHFSQSECLGDHNGVRDPISGEMAPEKFDYLIRGVLMMQAGFSYDFRHWPAWCLERLKRHIAFFKSISKEYIVEGDVHRLTGQVLRGGAGDRWQAYQYTSPRDGSHMIFVFRLAKAAPNRVIRLTACDAGRVYRVEYLDSGKRFSATGETLMEQGLVFDGMQEESSEIVRIR